MRILSSSQRLFGLLIFLQLGLIVMAQDDYAYNQNNRTKKNYSSIDKGSSPEKQTLYSVLKDLNRKKGVYFLFSDESMGNTLVSPVKENKDDIERILDNLLKNTGFKHKKISDNTFVIIFAKEKLNKEEEYHSLAEASNSPSEIRFETITGRVVGSDGKGIAQVSVAVKGTTRGTITNTTGDFTIEANRGEVLVFSFVGYQSQELTVGDNARIDVTLALANDDMAEVFVSALGIRRESKRAGYSISKLSGESVSKAREINVANSLVGRVAGVNVSGVSGGPGSSSNVQIRGVNSFGGSPPLYVINGVPMDNSTRGSAGMWGGADLGDGISNINPDDIEEITVLKGSAASALYGSRAAGGVIVITTKSGKNKQGIGVEVNSNLVIDDVIDYTDFQYEYGQGLLGVKPANQAAAYQSGASSWGARIDNTNVVQYDGVSRPYSAHPTNIKDFYQTGSTITNTVALSGGNENGNFRLSAANMINKSVVPNSGLTRNSLNLNVNGRLTKRLIINAVVNYLIEKSDNKPNLSDSPGNSNFGITFLPTTLDQDVLKPGNLPNGNEMNFSSNIYVTNPWFAANTWVNDLSRNRVISMASLRYNFTDWLYLQGRIGQDWYDDRTTTVTPTGTAYYPAGNLTEINTRASELNADFLVGFEKAFKNDFAVNFSVGGNLMKRSAEIITNTGDQFSIPFLYVLDNTKNKNSDYNLLRSEIQSFYYSAEFSFRNFLFLNTTGREDWFSTLPVENNHIFYPSVSASFVFSEFLKPSFLSYGKLRLAWANTSGGTAPYQTQLYYGIAGNINGYPIGVINNPTIPNANLTPYRMTELEAGFEVKLFKNRLGIDFAWFSRQTDREIVAVPASPTSGYTGATVNIGEMENKGVEILLTATPIQQGNFSWTTSFNYTKLNNKILKLSDGQSSQALGESRSQNAYVQHVVGLPASQVMAFDYRRDASGQIVYDNTGRPLQGLLIPMGSGIHDSYGGWNNEFNYKSFNFSFLIDFKAGAKIFSATDFYATIFGLHQMTLEGRESGIIGEGVNEAGQKNSVREDAWDYYPALASRVSSEFVYDADFIKLRQVIMGYTLPSRWFGRTPIQGISVSLVGRNLAILKKDTPNIDPESNYHNGIAQGLELAGVPPFRSYGVNINIKL